MAKMKKQGVLASHQKDLAKIAGRTASAKAKKAGKSLDVAGAKAFGFQAIWINRNNAIPDELGLFADIELNSISQIPEILA